MLISSVVRMRQAMILVGCLYLPWHQTSSHSQQKWTPQFCSLEVFGYWKSKDFVSVRVELAKSMRSSHGKYDLIYWRSEEKPRRRIKSDTKFWIWNICGKINFLSLPGFSWLGAVIRAVGEALGDCPSSSWGWTEFSEIRCLVLVSSGSFFRFSKQALHFRFVLATEILKV